MSFMCFVYKILAKLKCKNPMLYNSDEGMKLITQYTQQNNDEQYTLYIVNKNNEIVRVKINNKNNSILYEQNDFGIKTCQAKGKESQFIQKIDSLNSAFSLKG